MKEIFRKQLLDTFSERLQKNFTEYCIKQGLPPDMNTYTTYIVDRGLIGNSVIQQYAIQDTFEELKQLEKMKKTKLVEVLADRFNLSERSIWNALRQHRGPAK